MKTETGIERAGAFAVMLQDSGITELKEESSERNVRAGRWIADLLTDVSSTQC